MATISSLGVGSGIDINALVGQLVAAERGPKESRLTRDDAKLTAEFSALATLKGALSSLQSASRALREADSFALSRTVVGDEEFFTASGTGEAVPGNYDIRVQQLAAAARLGSGEYPGGAGSVIGTGTLSLTVGSTSFDVAITEDTDTLAQVRDAINSAAGNTVVRATLIGDASGSYLSLTSLATGAGNSIIVNATGATAGLQTLANDLNDFDADVDVAARDAIVHVSGYEIHSATNAISGAIDGVTLSLKKATEGTDTVSLSVQRDEAAIQKKAENFVAAFNVVAQQVKSLGRYDAVTKTAGTLLGDSLLRGVDTQLRRMLSEPVAGASGSHRTLTSLGIELTATGTLQLDAAKFKAALAADPDAVGRVFSSESGVAVRVNAFLDERLASSGEFAARDERISSQRRRLEQDREALDARMVVLQQRYLKQFTAMDTMLAQLQSTSSYLTQQLEGLANLANGQNR